MLTPYQPLPLADFRQPDEAERMRAALASVAGQLGGRYPLRIGGREVWSAETIVSGNPAHDGQVVGTVAAAGTDHVLAAVDAATRAFEDWSRTDPDARARCLLKAAALLRSRIHEYCAWLVCEVSKTWPEAYAEAAEAVDFMEYYAREMMRLAGAHPVAPYPGEENELRYVPLGVGAVIAPWNFPLAILCGMATAAAVAGNTVVAKPSSSSPVVAARLFALLDEAGFPAGVLNFVPGAGAQVGDVLVSHPGVRFVSFTGSREVGVRIFGMAAEVHPGQRWLKRTVLEMGGKDAIIVDSSADLSSAADGVVASAFGFQGQKCSACSRLIVVEDVHDRVLDAVADRAMGLTVGDPADRETALGAVIDARAKARIDAVIAEGSTAGRLVVSGGSTPAGGAFVPPTVIADVAPDARIAQEEIFGPVLAVLKARDFQHALEIANCTDYGLTGGVYSRDRRHLEQARREFHVGNLYFNRKCTGALVGVQPFGGFNMSGTDSKAGGPDYVGLFLQAKSITERF